MQLSLPENTKIFRLGHYSADKKRPVKVILPTKAHAVQALKCRKSIEDKTGMYMKSDQTPVQRRYLRQVVEKLENEKKEGKQNLILRYINDVPTIITKKITKN